MSAILLETCLIGLGKQVLNVRKEVTPEIDGRDVISTSSYLIVPDTGFINNGKKYCQVGRKPEELLLSLRS